MYSLLNDQLCTDPEEPAGNCQKAFDLYRAKFIGTGTSGAEVGYWATVQNQPQQIIVPCQFENIEWGVIRISLCNFQNKIEVQSIDYSFVESKEAIEIVKKLSKNTR